MTIYFEDIIGVGRLYLEDIYYVFEGEPILFLCTDKDGIKYLCILSEIRYGKRWYIAKCDEYRVGMMLRQEIDIASNFLRNDTLVVVESDLRGNERSRVERTDSIDILELPQDGICIGGEDKIDE